jgi:hypothetical protein
MNTNINKLNLFSRSVLFHHPEYAKYDKFYYGPNVQNAYYKPRIDISGFFFKYFQLKKPRQNFITNSMPGLLTNFYDQNNNSYVLIIEFQKDLSTDELRQRLGNHIKISQHQDNQYVVLCYKPDYIKLCEWVLERDDLKIQGETIIDYTIYKLNFTKDYVDIHRIHAKKCDSFDQFHDYIKKYNIQYCLPVKNITHLKIIFSDWKL